MFIHYVMLVYCISEFLFISFFFFFKQKTAYEMRISDWSSDVCSSDLAGGDADHPLHQVEPGDQLGHRVLYLNSRIHFKKVEVLILIDDKLDRGAGREIGRASCRERVCQSV